MTLHLIGVGLDTIEDMSHKAFKALESCEYIYLEHYTAILQQSVQEVEDVLNRKVIVADRNMVEKDAQVILDKAQSQEVALLIVGDVFAATTHTDFFLRARDLGIEVKIYHSGSILTAIGLCGLELYKYGKTTSMVFFDDNWKPQNVYDTLKTNLSIGLHTLILLDIKVSEPTREDLKKGKDDGQKPRFMDIKTAVDQLLETENERGENIVSPDTMGVGCARLGSHDFKIVYAPLKDLADMDFGLPMHSLIIPGKLHFVEEEALEQWK